MQVTCPAHQVIINQWNIGLPEGGGPCDPLPPNCAEWLNKVTQGTPAQLHPDESDDVDQLLQAEIAQNRTDVTHRLLRSVDAADISNSYRIFEGPDDMISVVFVQHCPVGRAVWTRLDVQLIKS